MPITRGMGMLNIRGLSSRLGVHRPRRWLPRGGSAWRLHLRTVWVDLYHYPHRGYYPRASSTDSGVSWSPYPCPEWGGLKMKRKVISQGIAKGGQKSLVSQDTKAFGKFPAVMSHIGDVVYDDGSPRKPGTVTVRTLGTSWQLIAKDPDAGAQLVALGQTVDEAMILLDRLLGAEDAPWELDPFAGGGRKKK